MNKFNMFITAVCVLFLIKLRWPKNKSIYDKIRIYIYIYIYIFFAFNEVEKVRQYRGFCVLSGSYLILHSMTSVPASNYIIYMLAVTKSDLELFQVSLAVFAGWAIFFFFHTFCFYGTQRTELGM